MYEGWAKRSGPCTTTFNDLLCFSKVFNQDTQKKVGTFQFKMQVKKNVVKYVVLCKIPRIILEMTKYVKICRIKFNCANANVEIHGDYYFLSIYIIRNKICIYIKILALLIMAGCQSMLYNCFFIITSSLGMMTFLGL
jgi:hypothetical protein